MRALLIALWFIGNTALHSQSLNFPAHIDFNSFTQLQLAAKDSSIHSGLQPYVHFFSDKGQYVSAPVLQKQDTSGTWLKRVLFSNDLISVDSKSDEFKLKINPILNLQVGKDLADSNRTFYTNTRGVLAAGSVGKRFYFETMFAENQSVLPNYLNNAAQATQVIPGQGRWKNFKANGYDYAFSSGFVSMMLTKNINLQVGHGKQKIGYGYRSLLLSDNSFNYPYLRISQQWFKGKLQYNNIYAVFMDLVPASNFINPNTESLFRKKCASFQYLSFNPNSYINLGLFQALMWQAGSSKNKQNLGWQYYNPLILSNIPQFGLDNKNNILLGADIRIKINSSFNVYAQAAIDSGSGNIAKTTALQAGAHYYFKKGKHLFHLQAEFNKMPCLQTGFTHYNQALAYTPQEGREILAILNYHYKRFFVCLKQQMQTHLKDAPLQNAVNITECRTGLVINPAYNMNLCLGALVRTQNFNIFKTLNNETNYFYLAFRTSIYNIFYDF